MNLHRLENRHTHMLNTTSLQAVSNSTFSERFVKPLYDSYCFSNIPQTIEFLLTGEGQSGLPLDVFGSLPTRYDKVILFFVDAFGWRFFERYAYFRRGLQIDFAVPLNHRSSCHLHSYRLECRSEWCL